MGTHIEFKMVNAGLFVLAAVLACGFAQDQTSEVAFSAGLGKHQYLTAGQRVKYDTIYTNVGGGYDTNTGTFTCPRAGLYVFQFHALSHSNSNMWLEQHYAAGGNSVILRLAKNDQVYVQATDASDLYGQPDEVYGTFSGYLISGIYEEFNVVGK